MKKQKYIYLKFIKWEGENALFTKKVGLLDKLIYSFVPLNALCKLFNMKEAVSLIIKIPKELDSSESN